MTPKGAAQPNRPETAPPSDGGAVSAGTAADTSAASGEDAATDPAGAAQIPETEADGTSAPADDQPRDTTIDLEVTVDDTDGVTQPAESADETAGGVESETNDGKETDVSNGKAAVAAPPTGGESADDVQSIDKELDTLRGDLGELTRDLQRITAEYANYRKRVDRDRALAAEQATGVLLTQLLPVLDDLDRARDHGDLVGPFGSVADQLTTVLSKFGLTAFGAEGDPFDPTLHEAVSHTSSPDVTETTCVQIMRRGYQLGERLLRPALVGVADPE